MDDELKKLLKRHEGQESSVYKDIKGIPTVGVGGNLQSPEIPQILEDLGTSREEVLSGKQLTPEQQEGLLDSQIQEKRNYFDNIRKRDFPEADITENEKTALESMMFQSPKLIGPNMRQLLQENKDIEAAKEILLRSNKEKSPGIAKRRLEESRMFAGDRYQELVDSLTSEEIKEVYNLVNSIKNPYTREEVLKEYPFLRQITKPNRYKKLRNK